MIAVETRSRGGLDRVLVYFRPRIATMLLLGFSSGLPFFLTGNTLGYWLRDSGTSLTAIGFLSWVGLAYSLKPLWAPLVDRVDVPIVGRLGRRRGWMFVAQCLVCLGLLAMAIIGPAGGLALLGACALTVAFASSTQDIVVDAWRIEVAASADELGLLSSAYQLGYRAAVLMTDALILLAAAHFGWPISYAAMAALMAVGLFATWTATEPLRDDAAVASHQAALPLWTARGFLDAVGGPFLAFFRAYGRMALLMLLMISLYRLPEYIMGPMANPFYHDVGLSKDVVGSVRASVGLVFSLLGVAAGGLSCVRLGYLNTLIVGAVVQALAVASFAILAYSGASIGLFSVIMAADNLAISFAGVALVTYMSSLTSIGYTATQYALLSSTYAYLGKLLKGPTGAVVEYLSRHGYTLMHAYGTFFMSAGVIGVPALILCIVLARIQRVPPHASGGQGAKPGEPHGDNTAVSEVFDSLSIRDRGGDYE